VKPPETIDKLKQTASEVAKALGKPQLSGSVEIHFHEGNPKNIETHERVKLTRE
jgi:hypothetical protein